MPSLCHYHHDLVRLAVVLQVNGFDRFAAV